MPHIAHSGLTSFYPHLLKKSESIETIQITVFKLISVYDYIVQQFEQLFDIVQGKHTVHKVQRNYISGAIVWKQI